MKEIVFASHNKDKVSEIRGIFGSEYQIKSLDDIGCIEEIPETADTLKGNAEIKATWVKDKYNYDCFADDTGLEVDSLNGEPGVYSARYAGENASYGDNCNKLLDEMQGKANRRARFKTAICLKLGPETHFFEGKIEGEILNEKRGESGFGYDPVFKPLDYEMTLAEMNSDLKNSISHRYNAVKKLAAFFGIKK